MTLEVDRRLRLVLGLTLLIGCITASKPLAPVPVATAPLASGDICLIFVVSEDLSNNESVDSNPATANLANQGLKSTSLTGCHLRRTALGNENVTGIFALEPMSHLQVMNQLSNI